MSEKEIEIEVFASGDSALEKAKERLNRYTKDNDITEIEVKLVIEESTEQVDTRSEIKPVDQGTKRYKVLQAVLEADTPVTNKEISHHLTGEMKSENISSVTHSLWDKGLLSREKVGRSYVYEITPFGKANLD